MNRDKNGRFVKVDNKEVTLEVGQNIKHSQLKEGMIIDFIATEAEIPVNNAIVVKDGNSFYAVHDNPTVMGYGPVDVTKKLGKRYSWRLDYRLDYEDDDYKDMFFRGWYKPEEKSIKKSEEKKIEEKPMKYKVGDVVYVKGRSGRVKITRVFAQCYEIIGIDIADSIGIRVEEDILGKAEDEVSFKVGQKINYSQLEDGMIIALIIGIDANSVRNAIVVKEDGCFYAVFDSPSIRGFRPNNPLKMLGRKYSWQLLEKVQDYSDMIFRGWYKPEEKKEVQSMYKIGDMVKFYGSKQEIIGIYEDRLWLKHYNDSNNYYSTSIIGNVSPWIDEPVKLKYQKDDLVQVTNGEYVKIVSISKDGVSYDSISLDGINRYNTLRDENIIRKIGVAVKE